LPDHRPSWPDFPPNDCRALHAFTADASPLLTKVSRENVENHAVPVEKKPAFFLPPILFALFLHSQKRTPRLPGMIP
jgi:hypothetical protein